jgi:hypothetical protein
MAITRSKASQLLNQKEMALYDESRINGLRQLDSKALATRVTRARAARDRARDLVQRQKLASRSRTGNKRGSSGADNQRSKDKAGLMADILSRFETRLREVQREEARAAKAAKSAGTRTVAKKSEGRAGEKTASKTAKKKTAAGATTGRTAKKTAAGATTGRTAKRTGEAVPATTQASRKSASKTTTRTTRADGDGQTRRSAGAASSAGASAREGRSAAKAKDGVTGKRARKRSITPEQALAQTQALLEAKQARDSEPKPWADAAGEVDPGSPGYQSDSAARRAKRLHAAEMRLPANQGSVSTHDRINQGKRDYRGRTDD